MLRASAQSQLNRFVKRKDYKRNSEGRNTFAKVGNKLMVANVAVGKSTCCCLPHADMTVMKRRPHTHTDTSTHRIHRKMVLGKIPRMLAAEAAKEQPINIFRNKFSFTNYDFMTF